MRLELQLRLKQVLAPQLIQSLKMLQMPLLRLEQTLRHELSTNPLLEEEEITEQPEDEREIAEPDQPAVEDNKIDWEAYLGDDSEFYPRSFRERHEELPEQMPVLEPGLYEYLIEQLNFNKLTAEEVSIGEFIIGNLDESGLLTVSVEEMAEALKVKAEDVERILKLVQTFDPPGVAARDLRENLLIQMSLKKMEGSLAWRIVDEHLHELARKTHLQLARIMSVPVERIQDAMEQIKTLSPTSVQGRFVKAALPIVPDLIVERIGEEYVVLHNDRHVPRLRINSAYRNLLKRGNNSPQETKKYVREKLEQARWLLNAVNQRRSTMVKVMNAIVEEQGEFFEKGVQHLKPLIMEEIAQKVGMNVATISRVANEKYAQTPQGIFEIKFFFNSGVARDDGDQMTKRNVKTRIQGIIDAEDPARPLSDQEIFRRLQADGIQLARRTVTKYREELKIQPARFRKRVVKKKPVKAFT
jgi:RNA polymerase sigma-54 factor